MPERRPRRRAALAAVVTVVLGLAGCGVSASAPTDQGDALSGGSTTADTEQRFPPSPDAATSADGLVTLYLEAAVGAIDQVKAFLTANALVRWRDPVNPDNPTLTIVRIVSQHPGTPSANRTPVIVDYQIVGSLNDQGRVDVLNDLDTREMTFWVVPDENNPSNLRVDQIDNAPQGLLLSDDALTEYYQIRPVYFWDQSYSLLIPDLRYLPLTITQDQRASRVVQWLAQGGPSSWLAGAQALPRGTSPDSVITDNGTLVVKLNAQAGAGGPEGLHKLMLQLQWSLRTNSAAPPNIRLLIDGIVQNVPTGPNDAQANQAANFRQSGQRYDIIDGKVVLSSSTGQPQSVLAVPENANVVAAAVNRNANIAAFVRTQSNGLRYLQIVRDGGAARLSPELLSPNIGRPVFVPDGKDLLLVTANGHLYAVSSTNGVVTDLTPRNISGITAVSVGPDGRRVAFVAGGQVYVTTLVVGADSVGVGPNPRPILGHALTANAVAWTTESWLYVAGTSPGGPALWRVTADGVVGKNLSDGLRQTTLTDLVAYPSWPPLRGNAEVIAYTQGQGIFTYVTSLTSETMHAPFFGG